METAGVKNLQSDLGCDSMAELQEAQSETEKGKEGESHAVLFCFFLSFISFGS